MAGLKEVGRFGYLERLGGRRGPVSRPGPHRPTATLRVIGRGDPGCRRHRTCRLPRAAGPVSSESTGRMSSTANSSSSTSANHEEGTLDPSPRHSPYSSSTGISGRGEWLQATGRHHRIDHRGQRVIGGEIGMVRLSLRLPLCGGGIGRLRRFRRGDPADRHDFETVASLVEQRQSRERLLVIPDSGSAPTFSVDRPDVVLDRRFRNRPRRIPSVRLARRVITGSSATADSISSVRCRTPNIRRLGDSSVKNASASASPAMASSQSSSASGTAPELVRGIGGQVFTRRAWPSPDRSQAGLLGPGLRPEGGFVPGFAPSEQAASWDGFLAVRTDRRRSHRLPQMAAAVAPDRRGSPRQRPLRAAGRRRSASPST